MDTATYYRPYAATRSGPIRRARHDMPRVQLYEYARLGMESERNMYEQNQRVQTAHAST